MGWQDDSTSLETNSHSMRSRVLVASDRTPGDGHEETSLLMCWYYRNTLIHLFAAEAEGIIKNHSQHGGGKPLFLWMAVSAPHVPVQAPQELIDQFPESAGEFRMPACGSNPRLAE